MVTFHGISILMEKFIGINRFTMAISKSAFYQNYYHLKFKQLIECLLYTQCF